MDSAQAMAKAASLDVEARTINYKQVAGQRYVPQLNCGDTHTLWTPQKAWPRPRYQRVEVRAQLTPLALQMLAIAISNRPRQALAFVDFDHICTAAQGAYFRQVLTSQSPITFAWQHLHRVLTFQAALWQIELCVLPMHVGRNIYMYIHMCVRLSLSLSLSLSLFRSLSLNVYS